MIIAAPSTKSCQAIVRGAVAGALLQAISLGTAAAMPTAQSDQTEQTSDAQTLDTVSVTGQGLSTKNAITSKHDAAVAVDSLDAQSIQVHSQEDSIAQQLISAPGISVMRDEDQPRDITARGVEANYNMTTLDGITLASVGDEGGGERKINLQLIPSDIAERIDIYKSFSAEQNPDSIGATIGLVTGSAFDYPRNSLHVDTSLNYHDLSNDDGRNSMPNTRSRWGGGFTSKYSTTFGSEQQFGITLSARKQQFQSSQNKLFQSTTAFYDDAGDYLSGPTSAGWNGLHAPYNIAYYADNRWIESDGGNAKFEWWPGDGALRASLVAYQYDMEEQRTENGYEIISDESISHQTATSGTTGIASINDIYQNKTWKRKANGVIGALEWTGDRQWMALRAGFTGDEVNIATDSIQLAATPTDATMNYASSAPDEIFNITSVSDPAMFYSSQYLLDSASRERLHATADVTDLRYDYGFNIDADARGFGIAAGVEHRRLDVETDVNTTDYSGGQDLSSYLYNPGWSYPKSPYSLPFFDYAKFLADGGWSMLPVDATTSLYDSLASDFRYIEDINDAYLSGHYSTDRLLLILGVRYDHTRFDARTAAVDSDVVSGTTVKHGGYNKLLPSFNATLHATDTINLRFSASKTIGRPIPSDIAQAESTSCDSDTNECTVSRGNPNLKPLQSTNLDLSVEKYFDDNQGYVSLALFNKNIKDNIVSIATDEVDSDGSVTTITTPTNVDDSWVRGVEFSYVQRKLELFDQHFDLLFNASLMDGKTSYTSDDTTRTVHQLIGQPRKIANLGVSWHLPFLDSTLTVTENYTGKYIFTMGANEWTDRGFRSRYLTDLAWSVQIDPHWSVSLSVANLFGADQYETLGDNYEYMRNVNNYAASYALHLRYDMN